MLRVALVHNPRAGDRYPDRSALLKLIRNAGYEVEYFSSGPADCRRAVESSPDLLAIAGGDGTVGKVARLAAGRGIPIGVLPLGTANNISTALGLADVPKDELVAGWKDAASQPFDVGVAHGPWGTFRFLESVGSGLLALVMADVEHGQATHVNEIADAAARIEAARDLFQHQLTQTLAVRFLVSLDGVDRSGDYLLVEALNFGVAGPNLRLAPCGNPADGLLDVVLAGDEHRQAVTDHLAGLLLEPPPPPRLPVHQARTVRFSCAACILHMDDKLWRDSPGAGGPPSIDLSVEPHALTFLRPR